MYNKMQIAEYQTDNFTQKRIFKVTGHSLRTLREKYPYTQKELSAKTGIPQGTISRFEIASGDIKKYNTIRILEDFFKNEELSQHGGENNHDKKPIDYRNNNVTGNLQIMNEQGSEYKVTRIFEPDAEMIELIIPLKGRTEKAYLSIPADYTEADLTRITKFIEALT